MARIGGLGVAVGNVWLHLGNNRELHAENLSELDECRLYQLSSSSNDIVEHPGM